jgi:hypothetical protein
LPALCVRLIEPAAEICDVILCIGEAKLSKLETGPEFAQFGTAIVVARRGIRALGNRLHSGCRGLFSRYCAGFTGCLSWREDPMQLSRFDQPAPSRWVSGCGYCAASDCPQYG